MYVLFYGYCIDKQPRWEAHLHLGDEEPRDPRDPRVRTFATESEAREFQGSHYHIAPEFWEVLTIEEAIERYLIK